MQQSEVKSLIQSIRSQTAPLKVILKCKLDIKFIVKNNYIAVTSAA
jgi:hypothetical protein